MTALNTFLEDLGRLIDREPAHLNAWMRELVRSKALVSRPGRGPGSGVELNAKNLSIFLLALLSSDWRRDAAAKVKAIGKAKPVREFRCPFTGADNLLDAFIAALNGEGQCEGKPATVEQILIYRDIGRGWFYWRQHDGKVFSVTFATAHPGDTKFVITGAVFGDTFADIAKGMKLKLGEQKND